MTSWRDDPDLKGRFHPDFPDDIQVVVHEGSFRFTEAKPEVMWARIEGKQQWSTPSGQTKYAYKAILLNQPHQLETLKVGDAILFVAYKEYKYPIRVTREYLVERADYGIIPCDQCGLPELFDLISDLLDCTFPTMGKQLGKPDEEQSQSVMFTSICPACGGIMMVQHKSIL